MKYIATLLLILGFGLSAFGQTIKSLGFNTTNGVIVANTGTNVLTFTDSFNVTVSGDTMTYSLSGISGWGDSFSLEENFLDGVFSWDAAGTNGFFEFAVPISFANNFGQGAQLQFQSRANLGLGSGITTNRTFVSYNGTNYTTNTVTISNGIITGWTQ